ncbi:MAG: hypothetical protein K6U04_02115 [Armatimonadetes bacterium]|nr:hypothetical protein [Armatimonadota bacterium]
MQKNNLLSIKYLDEIIRKNLYDDYLIKSLKKIIAYETRKTRKELESLKGELRAYETKYNMTSEDFYNKFTNGLLGDEADYFEWSAIYKMYLRSLERLSILEGEYA